MRKTIAALYLIALVGLFLTGIHMAVGTTALAFILTTTAFILLSAYLMVVAIHILLDDK